MTTINCTACGFTNTVPEDRELEETRAEVRRLQAARVGFALVSREQLRAIVVAADAEYGTGATEDQIIDKALGLDAFAS